MKTFKYILVCAVLMWLFIGNVSQCGSLEDTSRIGSLQVQFDSLMVEYRKLDLQLDSLNEKYSLQKATINLIEEKIFIDSVVTTWVWSPSPGALKYRVIFCDVNRDHRFKMRVVEDTTITVLVPVNSIIKPMVSAIGKGGESGYVEAMSVSGPGFKKR